MTISSISSGNYYMEQMSAMWARSNSAETAGRMPQNTGMGNRPDPAAIFTKTDSDGSGGLDQTEFQTLAAKISEATGEEVDVEELFATYDEDEDGVLSEEENQAAMEANRPQGPPPQMGMMGGMGGQMFSDADEDEDGVLSEEETLTALEANRPERPPLPPEGVQAESEGFQTTISAGIENYLKMAALGSEQNQLSNIFSMFDGNDNSNASGALFPVNTRA